MPEVPRVAVVVCCRDRAELLDQALGAVLASLREGDELVVVDSASRDPGVQEVARRRGARVVASAVPGLSRARNIGWRATTHDLVLFTDDDCVPVEGWRQAAVDAFADPTVGAIWGDVEADRETAVPLSSGEADEAEVGPDTVLSGVGHGASMAFRRATLERLGGFDELLGAGGYYRAGEDKDAFWRTYTAGWRAILVPGMAVTHVVHRDTTTATRIMRGYGLGAGAVARKRQREIGIVRTIHHDVWLHGLLPALRHAKHGRWAASRATALRLLGFLIGWGATQRLHVVDGHLAPRAGMF